MNLEPIERMARDIRSASKTLSDREARYLVDSYYQMQENRIRAAGQIRSVEQSEEDATEPHETLSWFEHQAQALEGQIKSALDAYSLSRPVGVWSRSVCGIGPVLAAGLLANIDITRCPTAGHIWAFAGLDPTRTWEKGQKRPWNASLKTLCWKIGESFVKVSGREDAVYGHVYQQRKEYEREKNEAGDYAEQAARILAAKKFRADTKAKAAYEAGRLPDGHIHARAKRYAVKLFLSQWHAEEYRSHYGCEPPKPYAVAILGHAHVIGSAPIASYSGNVRGINSFVEEAA